MDPNDRPTIYWVGRGARAMASVPAFILLASMTGFGVLCRESGLTLGQTMFMTAAVWALPSQVVLVGAIVAKASLAAAAVGVTLSAVRFVPMVASWVPMVRSPGRPVWQYVIFSHFLAVTSWVVAATYLPALPPRGRLPFFAGFALCLTSSATLVAGLSFVLSAGLPAILSGMLFFLTPIYFITSLTAAARLDAERFALIGGVVLGPLFRMAGLPLDLVWAGLLGGTLAFIAHHLVARRR